MMTLPIGYYFERFLNWLVTHCADFTRWCSANIDVCVDWLRNLFLALIVRVKPLSDIALRA